MDRSYPSCADRIDDQRLQVSRSSCNRTVKYPLLVQATATARGLLSVSIVYTTLSPLKSIGDLVWIGSESQTVRCAEYCCGFHRLYH